MRSWERQAPAWRVSVILAELGLSAPGVQARPGAPGNAKPQLGVSASSSPSWGSALPGRRRGRGLLGTPSPSLASQWGLAELGLSVPGGAASNRSREELELFLLLRVLEADAHA